MTSAGVSAFRAWPRRSAQPAQAQASQTARLQASTRATTSSMVTLSETLVSHSDSRAHSPADCAAIAFQLSKIPAGFGGGPPCQYARVPTK